MSGLTVVTLTSNADLYRGMTESFAAAHPGLHPEFLPIDAQALGWTPARALNHGLQRARHETVACIKQEVRFPEGWWSNVRAQLEGWVRGWAVAGVLGVRMNGAMRGHTVDADGEGVWGPLPGPVLTLDEHVLVLDRRAGLAFDPACPSDWGYAADLALQAWDQGPTPLCVDAPVEVAAKDPPPADLDRGAAWLVDKWGGQLKGLIPTTKGLIGEPKLGNLCRYLRLRYHARQSGRTGSRSADPEGPIA